jgi:carbon storage regulator
LYITVPKFRDHPQPLRISQNLPALLGDARHLAPARFKQAGRSEHGKAALALAIAIRAARTNANESQKETEVMLVLTRKLGEEIIINGEICVSVVRLRGNRVQIGIKAPAGVPIRRRELLDEKPANRERTPVACQ